MRDHIGTGKMGEALAIDYLFRLGFTIIEKNWRYSRSEIDLIASLHKTLHFIEVKTRSSVIYGFPEESVSNKKISTMLKGAAAYCYQHPQWKLVQYDVLSILLAEGKEPEYLLIQDIA